jgi:hypothetical protein
MCTVILLRHLSDSKVLQEIPRRLRILDEDLSGGRP